MNMASDILIIDDEADIRELVAGILEDLPSCAELIESIVAEAVKHLQAASALVQD